MQCAIFPIRNAEARGSSPLCSTIYFQPFTAGGNGGCFGQVANTWTVFLEFNCTASTAARLLSSTVVVTKNPIRAACERQSSMHQGGLPDHYDQLPQLEVSCLETTEEVTDDRHSSSSVVKVKRSGTMRTLRRLFAHSDDAARPLVVARPRYQFLEFELLSILARLSPTPNVSVSVRSTRSMLSEYAARKFR